MAVGSVALLVFALLAVLLLSRAPVALALMVSGATGLLLLRDAQAMQGALANQPFASTASYTLLVIPMFILMGAFARHSGIAEEAFDWLNARTQRLPGGIAFAALSACAAFAAISGSSVATVATVGRVSLREMRRHGYDEQFSAGIIAAAGTLGVLIPPSIMLVLYGIITGESIGPLLLAGFVPGLVSAVAYGGAILYKAVREPASVGRHPAPEPEQVSAASSAAPTGPDRDAAPADVEASEYRPAGNVRGIIRVAILGVLVIGGLYGGVFTATEASVIGAAAAGLMMLVHHLRRPGLLAAVRESFREATDTTAMIFFLIIGAGLFTSFLVTARLPSKFANWLLGFDVPDLAILLLLLLLFVPLGMFLEGVTLLIIAVPLVYPIATDLGYNGLWFGIMVVKMIEIGLITPPVGLNAYVVAGVDERLSVGDVFRGVRLFLAIDALTVVFLVAFPGVVLWLPNAMM